MIANAVCDGAVAVAVGAADPRAVGRKRLRAPLFARAVAEVAALGCDCCCNVVEDDVGPCRPLLTLSLNTRNKYVPA